MGVATAVAIGGLIVSAASAGASAANSAKQKGLQRQAERDAENSFKEAQKDLGKNYYQAIGIQKEPYELSREGLLSSSFGLTQAAQESERGAAEAAGRIYLASQQGQGQVRTEQGQELLNLEKLTAQENSRLRDIGVGLNLEQAAGYQEAARQAAIASDAAKTQAISSATDAIKTGIKEIVPLFPNTGTAKTAIPATVTNPATATTAASKSIGQTNLQGSFNWNQGNTDINGNPINVAGKIPTLKDIYPLNNLALQSNQNALPTNYYMVGNQNAYNPFQIYQ